MVTANKTQFGPFQIYADQAQNPNNADWTPEDQLAPAEADDVDNNITVRAFDDGAFPSNSEGIGFVLNIPAGANNMIVRTVARARTAGGAARTVGLDIYNQAVPDNAAVGAWSSATALTDRAVPDNIFFQYEEESIDIASLAGQVVNFEVVRDTPTGGTNLVGDWLLMLLEIEFTS